MDIKRIPSDRGQQIAHRQRNPLRRHVTDVRGAMGCYFCWLGQFDKCREHCQLVHNAGEDVTRNLVARGVHGTGTGKAGLDTEWDRAAAWSTKEVQRSKSLFDVDQRSRSVRSASVGGRGSHSLNLAGYVDPDRSRSIVAQGMAPHSSMLEADAVSGRRSPSQAAASRVYSLHRPMQPTTLYKHPHGSELVQATEYTTLCITPSSHCYNSQRKCFVSADDAVWSGQLAKGAGGPHAAGGRSPSPSVSRRLQSSDASFRSRQGHGGAGSSSSLAGASLANPKAMLDEQLSAILSGRFDDAFAMPIPSVFREV